MKHSIKTMNQLAKLKGMRFLSKKFTGVSKNHLWLCANGHRWNARPDNIKISVGKCNKCYGRERLTVERIREIIEKKGGQLLSDGFKDGKSYIQIRCSKKHNWETQVLNIKQGKWCPDCARNARLTIEDAYKLAEKRGGKCLSTVYVNANQLLEWQCSEEHKWKATYGNVYSGNWCKKCSESLGERICKEFFEQLFKESFPKAYPKWLVNNEGNALEFDGYCEKLKIAFEHQGSQHFEKTRLFTKDENALDKRKEWDEIKRLLCKRMGITLIEIPEVNKYLKPHELKNYIKEECLKRKIRLPNDFDEIEVDYNKVYKTAQWREKLEEIKQIAISKGGKCLSTFYKTNSTYLLFRCKENHKWPATPNKIKLGRWCPDCAHIALANKKRKRTFEEIQKIAISRRGKCLSKEYLGGKLLFECAFGHTWDALPSSIKRGTWCRVCNKNALLTIEEMQQLAKSKGGKCLSKKYINNNTKLLWECKVGHTWKATPGHVKDGTWCKICFYKNDMLTIEEMHELAKSRGGKCLSKKYIGSNIKLLWQCKEGHIWEATPSGVKHGNWCGECYKRRTKS